MGVCDYFLHTLFHIQSLGDMIFVAKKFAKVTLRLLGDYAKT